MDGKQVAILVPTTVLAQQHFNTFRERMADYPIRVELLSRYRTRREQVRVGEAVADHHHIDIAGRRIFFLRDGAKNERGAYPVRQRS